MKTIIEVFPGFSAWASLKPDSSCSCSVELLHVFPGFSAWASLKHTLRRQVLRCPPRFPRLFRLGLIEADPSALGTNS